MGRWTKNLSSDISAGFAVSLIALPLSLGLATASGVPPMAGVIPAIIGGIIVAIFGGSHVTISGPGYGLVVVILAAVTLLGQGDPLQGYLLTCAAVVVSGILLFLFGLIRLGALGDFFPSSAIQGLLAAIGLIIISKQFHVMLGVSETEAKGSLGLLLEIPRSIYRMAKSPGIPWEGIIGLVSGVIMFGYAKVKWKPLHWIPAPMWVLFLAIGFWAYHSFISMEPYPIDEAFLIPIPDNLMDSVVFPDFSRLTHPDFWVAVISITLLSSIESLLSIKAVDKLDPLARRSNINKDLKALGLGSILSGLAGGLPVVMVIARSSVNVNNGATSRKANFFHAFFLLVFILLVKDVLRNVPVSALAGILVYTGYKLAAPQAFKKVARIGKGELFIFIGTLLGTLAFGLLQGIIVGILLTIGVQLSQLRSVRHLFRYVFRPNTLLYQESEQKFYLGIKGYAGFMNYLRLKSKLDSIPHKADIVLDMSLTQYVDHSVMEHIHYYADEVQRRGGTLEVIGLDIHGAETAHPFASRKMGGLSRLMGKVDGLTKRQELLQNFCEEKGWKFDPEPVANPSGLRDFRFGKRKQIGSAYNACFIQLGSLRGVLRDVEFTSGEFIAKETVKTTVMVLDLPFELPDFILLKEDVFRRFVGIGSWDNVVLNRYPEFAKKFYLKSEHPEALKAWMPAALVNFFVHQSYYHIEVQGKSMLLFEKERLASVSEVEKMVQFAQKLLEVLEGLEAPKSS